MPVDHYENFPVASWLLPPALREAVAAIYGFARSADDIADEGTASAEERLAALQRYRSRLTQDMARVITGSSPGEDAIFARLHPVIAEHALPLPLFFDLLDAFSQDVVKTRYESYDELLDYCRRSAMPIGRLMLRLYRAEEPQQLAWSDAICTGLQLINHWQDVAQDWQRGRVYLPREDLARYGVSLDQLAAGQTDRHWRALLSFELERARGLMLAGAPLAASLSGRIGFELRLIVAGGLRIIDKIIAVDFDVFHHRPTITAFDWPLLLGRAMLASHR
jgi:squalene synthase HpnC